MLCSYDDLCYMHCPAWQILCNPAFVRAAMQIKSIIIIVTECHSYMQDYRTDCSVTTDSLLLTKGEAPRVDFPGRRKMVIFA